MPLRWSHARLRVLATRFVADPGARLLARLGLTPNMVTLLGLALSVASAYLVARGWLAAGGIVLLAGGAMDLWDGALARLTGKGSRFGALLDSVVDRVSEATLLFGVLWLALGTGNRTLGLLAFLAVVSSMMVSYVRARAEGLGIPGEAGFMARPERVVLLAAGLLAGQITIALGVMTVLSTVTTLQRTALARRS